jgi:hypothetical protein
MLEQFLYLLQIAVGRENLYRHLTLVTELKTDFERPPAAQRTEKIKEGWAYVENEFFKCMGHA